MITLSHFDFLFCLPSLATASVAIGTDCKPLATAAEPHVKWQLNLRTALQSYSYPENSSLRKNLHSPGIGMLGFCAPAIIPAWTPPAINSTFWFFLFSWSFLSLSRLMSASAVENIIMYVAGINIYPAHKHVQDYHFRFMKKFQQTRLIMWLQGLLLWTVQHKTQISADLSLPQRSVCVCADDGEKERGRELKEKFCRRNCY